jgi:hypothetical protein
MKDELTFSAAILATNKGPLKPVAKISPRTKITNNTLICIPTNFINKTTFNNTKRSRSRKIKNVVIFIILYATGLNNNASGLILLMRDFASKDDRETSLLPEQ